MLHYLHLNTGKIMIFLTQFNAGSLYLSVLGLLGGTAAGYPDAGHD